MTGFNGNGNGNGWGGGRRREGGGDIDYLWESPAYERMYDKPDTESNSAEFLEQPDWIREGLIRSRGSLNTNGSGRSKPQVMLYWPDVGPFAIPRQNTWAAHRALIDDPTRGLEFNPAKHQYFDRIIAARFPAVMKPENAGLRANLEVLRNDIMGFYMQDGSFDIGDEVYVPLLATAANALGTALANDTWWKRPFTRSISVDVASAEGVGAAEMYQHLREIQDKPGLLSSASEFLRSRLNMPTRAFGLPPISDTAFSPRALAAPPPELVTAAPGKPSNFAERVSARSPVSGLQKG